MLRGNCDRCGQRILACEQRPERRVEGFACHGPEEILFEIKPELSDAGIPAGLNPAMLSYRIQRDPIYCLDLVRFTELSVTFSPKSSSQAPGVNKDRP